MNRNHQTLANCKRTLNADISLGGSSIYITVSLVLGVLEQEHQNAGVKEKALSSMSRRADVKAAGHFVGPPSWEERVGYYPVDPTGCLTEVNCVRRGG